MPFHLEMLYRALVVEMVSPVRIIFGYEGFKSESSLREGFLDFIEKHGREKGFGGSSLPSLIVCGQFSLVKLNGYPFTTHLHGADWMIYGSSHENPLYFLLEMLWTRLSHKFKMPDWFMSDLTINQLSPLLSGRAVQVDDIAGWEYSEHSPELLPPDRYPAPLSWTPVSISEFGERLVSALSAQDSLPNTTEHTGVTEDEKREFQKLVDARVIGFQDDRIVFLTTEAAIVCAPDGNMYVGDNAAGRFARWISETFSRKDTTHR